MEVHRELGPGLLESAYATCLAHEFELRSIPFKRELSLPVRYKGLKVDAAYRMDFVVAEELLLELKSVQQVEPIHTAQVLTYLRLSGLRKALLMNFNERLLKDGLTRIVL